MIPANESVHTGAGVGPLALDAKTHAVSRPVPLQAVKIDEGSYFGSWQGRNARVTVRHLFTQLREHDAIDALRSVRDPSIQRAGMWFSDSDVYKALEAALWNSLIDDTLLADIGYDELVEVIGAAQESDGYVNSWFQVRAPELRWRDLASGHEMYTAGHLIQAGIAEARVLGRQRLFQVACRCADLLVSLFGEDAAFAADGHPEVETALVELSRETGNRKYLDLARKMLEGRGDGLVAQATTGAFHPAPALYIQDHQRIRESHRAVGHAVRQMYLNLGIMDVYLETGDDSLMPAQTAMWSDIDETKMYIHGGIGSRHRDESFGDAYELPNDRAYAETCASIGHFMWSWKMLLATGDARYADRMERVIYNVIAGAVSADGTRFFYSNPLHRRSDHLVAFDEESSERLPWYRVPCCPANIARLIGTLNAYLVSESDDAILIHQYVAGTFENGETGPSAWSIRLETDLPNSGAIRVRVDSAGGKALHFRVPSWSPQIEVFVDGFKIVTDVRQGYLDLGIVPDGTEVQLLLNMQAQIVLAHPLNDSARGCVAITRGPQVFALDHAAQASDVDIERFIIDQAEPILLLEGAGTQALKPSLQVTGSIIETPRIAGGFAPSIPVSMQSMVVELIPYSQWGNPADGGMRVWIPRLPQP